MNRWRPITILLVSFLLLGSQAGSQETALNYYEKWLKEDVFWIISEEEKDVFRKLTTDDERDAFIEQFWLRRDPDPATSHNEFKEEHYRRIAYANEKFTAGIDGWKTDRGMVYIKFGPPDAKETYPAGGQYERRLMEGGGATQIFPMERWTYHYIEGIGQDVELEFVDDEGGGLYELTWDKQRKDALLYTGNMSPTLYEIEASGGNQFTANRQARAAGRRHSGDWAGTMRGASSWETYRDRPFELAELSARLNRPAPVKFKDLEAVVSTRISYNQIGFDVRTDYIRMTDEQTMALVTVLVPNDQMTFRQEHGLYHAGAQIFGRITDLSNRVVTHFESDLAREYNEADFQNAKSRSSIYQKRMILEPGLYKLDVGVKDVQSEQIGTVTRRLEAPRIEKDRLSLSSLILAHSISAADWGRDGGIDFNVGDLKVIPNTYEEYRKSDDLGLYLQIYGFGVEQQTGRPALNVEYALTPRGIRPELWRDSTAMVRCASDYCRMARMITLGVLDPGHYELHIRATDRITRQTASAFTPMRIVP